MGNISELREKNNQWTLENITLEYGPPPQHHLEFGEILLSAESAFINDYIYFNITIRNVGDVQATYVDVQLFINEEYQYFQTIDTINSGKTGNLTFQISGDTGAVYEVYFVVKDDFSIEDISDDYYIEFIKLYWEPPVIPTPPPPPPPDDDTFSLDLRVVLILTVIAFLTLIPFMVLVRHWRSDGEVDVDSMKPRLEKSTLLRKDSKDHEPDEFEKE